MGILKYLFDKDNVPKTLASIMWEESRLGRKHSVIGLKIIDTKLLCNQCSLAKNLYNRWNQDTILVLFDDNSGPLMTVSLPWVLTTGSLKP